LKISTKSTKVLSLQKPKAVYVASEQQYVAAGRDVLVPSGVTHE